MSHSPPPRSSNFLQLFGNRSLNEVFADWNEVDVVVSKDPWPEFPPDAFLEFCVAYPRFAFDGVPPAPQYLKPPSFLLCQVHRMWQTLRAVHEALESVPGGTFVDLGSFPFVIPLLLRDYHRFSGRIIATRNLDLPEGAEAALRERGIESPLMDLDPFVRDPKLPPQPDRLDLADGSVDVILLAHVIEHLYHPMCVLRECARLLRPGGKLIVTTDNAMMIDTLINFAADFGYLSEPVEGTAAMTFSFWRGHVRYFTQRDLETMIGASGFRVDGAKFHHIFYDALFPEYFSTAHPRLHRWKHDIVRDHPQFRNDITIVASRIPTG